MIVRIWVTYAGDLFSTLAVVSIPIILFVFDRVKFYRMSRAFAMIVLVAVVISVATTRAMGTNRRTKLGMRAYSTLWSVFFLHVETGLASLIAAIAMFQTPPEGQRLQSDDMSETESSRYCMSQIQGRCNMARHGRSTIGSLPGIHEKVSAKTLRDYVRKYTRRTATNSVDSELGQYYQQFVSRPIRVEITHEWNLETNSLHSRASDPTTNAVHVLHSVHNTLNK
ncbi:hypothetical protein BS50DRAFT_257656 [Corynespora cassiicola Philippines]|uniref:Uncharacterized protein n=1 Tax=Corynespora cassiicola Philippines TaxID=1448308 RepID=A0A2T2P4Z0_CORCC|nr:hypothetical protein BS50DRAFT_257656 [Corynespora cassiicola Philippines]